MPSTTAIVVLPADPAPALLRLRGRPLLSWALAGLAAVAEIEQVLVATPTALDPALLAAGAGRARTVAARGPRLETIRGALILAGPADRILIHDAQRPLAAVAGVALLLARLEEAEVAVTAAPVRSTIKRVREGVIEGTVPRESLLYPQAPIAFRRETLDRVITAHPGAPDELRAARLSGCVIAVQPALGANPLLRTAADVAEAEPLLARGVIEAGA
ncbi:MAG TPA: 2-C-methyl-D-erythritol 4-phosphate cytidylyltransferase [Candidatus Dormibacteraeota bacterium]|jgi:2-C-methyl-D-erythritol 4-phosphate cytidylyltransferase|nr:2-C-methyl-D-erythritol 4-phosphate cytidylyltransferase [Candidatus Dormibacteraeota bacterium]